MHTVRRSATPWKLQKCDKCIEPAGRPAWIVGEIWTHWKHGFMDWFEGTYRETVLCFPKKSLFAADFPKCQS